MPRCGDDEAGRTAQFMQLPALVSCSPTTMKTFLKILLAAVLLIIAIKISPILFLAALVGLFAAGVLGVVGVSLVVAFLAVALAFAVALSPIWIPVLIVIGLVSLFKGSKPAAPAAPTPAPAAPAAGPTPPPVSV